MTAAIELDGLTKVYGAVRALDDVDLAVEEGAVHGFLGPNGAGKTTTLRILGGLASPTSGSARIFGRPAGSAEARGYSGYLPDVPGFYDWMTAEEFLRFAGRLFGLAGATLDERVRVLLDLSGLSEVSSRVGGFSRGMKQRLGIAQALVNAPRVLMLDEPTSALDPIGRRDVLEMIASLAGRTTVFFSTHILADVERVCESVTVLDRGRVVAEAPIAELKSRYASRRLLLEVEGDPAPVERALSGAAWLTGTRRTADGALSLTVTDARAAGREIPSIVSAAGLSLLRYESGEVGLEEVFVDLVGREGGDDR